MKKERAINNARTKLSVRAIALDSNTRRERAISENSDTTSVRATVYVLFQCASAIQDSVRLSERTDHHERASDEKCATDKERAIFHDCSNHAVRAMTFSEC